MGRDRGRCSDETGGVPGGVTGTMTGEVAGC